MSALKAAYDLRDLGRGERVLTVGDAIPECRLPALAATVGSGWEFDTAWLRGRWVALLYWPKQSCLESIHEVAELVRISPAFAAHDTLFVAVCAHLESDSRNGNLHCRLASDLPFPVLVDVRGELAGALGLDAIRQARPLRASFIADPASTVRWTSVSELPALHAVGEAAHALESLRGQSAATHSGGRLLIRSCAWCKRLQDEGGWHAPETYIRRHSGADITHGICQDCLRQQSPR